MTIFQRHAKNDSFWIDFRMNGKRIRRKSPTQTLEGAHAFELQLQRALLGSSEDETLPQGPETLYRDFVERWLTDYVDVANKATTRREKQQALAARLLPGFGHLPLRAITTGIVDVQVARWKRNGLSMKYINNLLTILRRSLGCAEEWNLIQRAPLIRHHKTMPPLPQFLRPEESDRVIAELSPGLWRTLGLFMVTTGARFGEAAALKWTDLELDDVTRPFVSIRRSVCLGIVDTTKTQTSRRSIPLVTEMVIALRTLRSKTKSEWVFPKPDGGFLTPSGSSHVLKNACARAGVPQITWHKLRHTCATQLMAAGVPIMAIKSVLGHTSVTTTAIYAHVVPELMWDYMNLLSPEKRKEGIAR